MLPQVFTKENAAEMARRSHAPNSARHTAKPQPLPILAPEIDTADTQRKRRLGAQVDLIDQDIQTTRDPELRCKLIAAKARLWELLYPKPGSLRPKAGRSERAPVVPLQPITEPIQPQPVVNQPALVVPEIEQSHKSENVQS